MDRVIHHHELQYGPFLSIQEVEMIDEAQILCIQVVDGRLRIYESHTTPKRDKVTRTFAVIGTGVNFDLGQWYRYVGTAQTLFNGQIYVWHIYEITVDPTTHKDYEM